MTSDRKYGWLPDLPDKRDLIYKSYHKATEIPDRMDLTPQMPIIYQQGSLGSCTAQAIGAAIEHAELKQKKLKPCTPSRLFIYYNERKAINTTEIDSGAYIRDGIKSLHKDGYCEEHHWPYEIKNWKTIPPGTAYDDARKSKVESYQRVNQTQYSLMKTIADGKPVIFGFSVYSYFESAEMAKFGILKMPNRKEKLLGGHAVLMVGYDKEQERFLVRNSWGKAWGLNGYFWMPFAYVLDNDLADDFWVINFVPQVD